MSSRAMAKELIGKANVMEAKRSNDTIRLWESYRDQATLWRAIALLQIPATCAAIIFSIYIWSARNITLNVPAKPLPGTYAVQEIPDTEFIDTATDFLNLIATYQYRVARRQFEEASKMLYDQVLAKFNEDILGAELRTIESTNRTQVFYIDPLKTAVDRSSDGLVTVSMIGDRQKIIAGQEVPLVKTKFIVTLRTLPRNKLNPYGITISDYTFENVER